MCFIRYEPPPLSSSHSQVGTQAHDGQTFHFFLHSCSIQISYEV